MVVITNMYNTAGSSLKLICKSNGMLILNMYATFAENNRMSLRDCLDSTALSLKYRSYFFRHHMTCDVRVYVTLLIASNTK